jgi:hypothetical protein
VCYGYGNAITNEINFCCLCSIHWWYEAHQNCATMQLVQLCMLPSCHSVSGAVLWTWFF